MLRIGTRASLLARTQSTHVGELLRELLDEDYDLVHIRAEGDDLRVPLDAPRRPGVFVATLREALAAGAVDLVVHSFKDLPSAPLPGLVVAAVPARVDARDVLVSRGPDLSTLPTGAVLGTSSPRRAAAIRRARPDLECAPIRGNVDTRLGLVESGRVDAVVLALAGLTRLGLAAPFAHTLPVETMIPAPAQGALAVECRTAGALAARLCALENPIARATVVAERAVLEGIEATCTTAVGALATWAEGRLELIAELSGHRGVDYARSSARRALPDPSDLDGARELGLTVAAHLLGERS